MKVTDNSSNLMKAICLNKLLTKTTKSRSRKGDCRRARYINVNEDNYYYCNNKQVTPANKSSVSMKKTEESFLTNSNIDINDKKASSSSTNNRLTIIEEERNNIAETVNNYYTVMGVGGNENFNDGSDEDDNNGTSIRGRKRDRRRTTTTRRRRRRGIEENQLLLLNSGAGAASKCKTGSYSSSRYLSYLFNENSFEQVAFVAVEDDKKSDGVDYIIEKSTNDESKRISGDNGNSRRSHNNNNHNNKLLGHQMIPLYFNIMLMLLITTTTRITSVEGVDCFKCSSRNGSNPACEDPFHNLNTTKIISPVLPDPSPNVIYHAPCYAGKKGREGLFPASACIKLTGTFESGETLVVRHCALDSGTLTQDTELARMSHCGKFQFEGDLLKGCVLACPEDACNGANKDAIFCGLTYFIIISLMTIISNFVTIPGMC